MIPELNAYIEARRAHDAAKQAEKRARQALDNAEAALVDRMVEDEAQSIKLDDGTNFFLSRRPRFRLNEANNDMVREWLRETVGDDDPFVETKVVRKRLSEHLNELLEDCEESDLPDFLEFTSAPEIAVRGWANHATHEER